jgi:hypothetical protein
LARGFYTNVSGDHAELDRQQNRKLLQIQDIVFFRDPAKSPQIASKPAKTAEYRLAAV